MAKKPNYDFERRERQRLQAEKKARRAKAKNESRIDKSDHSDQTDTETVDFPPPDKWQVPLWTLELYFQPVPPLEQQ